ncbi:hypothetical protein [Neotabrizicola sp. sgz301269]|uniref:hypothetical protein n=1 Tax=Neotabrizicola sp. sgz301269 TaxID=3276282 RepID=UPI00376FDDA3
MPEDPMQDNILTEEAVAEPAAEAESLPQSDAILLVDLDGGSRPRCLISALGPGLPAREALLAGVAQSLWDEGKRPVICATGLSLPFLADAPVAIELLPTRADLRLLAAAEYESYLRRRYEVVLAKWAVTEEITLGEEFEDFLAREAALPV